MCLLATYHKKNIHILRFFLRNGAWCGISRLYARNVLGIRYPRGNYNLTSRVPSSSIQSQKNTKTISRRMHVCIELHSPNPKHCARVMVPCSALRPYPLDGSCMWVRYLALPSSSTPPILALYVLLRLSIFGLAPLSS